MIVGIRQEEMWLSRRISSWVRVWNFILGIKNSIGSAFFVFFFDKSGRIRSEFELLQDGVK